jgi:hypothetical protein
MLSVIVQNYAFIQALIPTPEFIPQKYKTPAKIPVGYKRYKQVILRALPPLAIRAVHAAPAFYEYHYLSSTYETQ